MTFPDGTSTSTTPTYTTATNIVRLIEALRNSRTGMLSLLDAAERIGVSDRSIRRYVHALESHLTSEDGSPLLRIEQRGGRSCLIYGADRADMTTYQYAAVEFALSSLRAIKEPLFTDISKDVGDRLEHDMRREHGSEAVALLKRVFGYVPFGPKRYESSEDVISGLFLGALRRNEVDVTYHPVEREPFTTRIRPWAILLYRDALYVRCEALRRNGWQQRTFAIDRISEVLQVSPNVKFEVPASFDASSVAADGLGIWRREGAEPERIVIEFAPDAAARAIERNWPGIVEDPRVLEDGWTRITVEIPVTPEVVTWLMTWGGKARVVAPESLMEEMRVRFGDALEHYI